MTPDKTMWLLVSLLCLSIGCGDAVWRMSLEAGREVHERGKYAEAERQFKDALERAEEFPPQDPRLATSLNDLALLYAAQGKYSEAEPLYQRSLAIREKVLGPQHPDVAQSLENYAALLRRAGRDTEADSFTARAELIRGRADE